MDKELLLDIMCYLRSAGKYDDQAKNLCNRLIDNVTVIPTPHQQFIQWMEESK